MSPSATAMARLGLVIAVALLTGWVATAAFYFVSHGGGPAAVRPAPGQVAALVELFETSDTPARARLLTALNTPAFYVGLDDGPVAPPPRAMAAPEEIANDYRAALGARVFAAFTPPLPQMLELSFRRLPWLIEPIGLRVGLKGGATLALESRNAVLTTRMGLPIGFGAALLGTLVALAATALAYAATRPLTHLARAVDAMDLAGESRPIPGPTAFAPEIRAVVAAFNRLQERLSKLLRARLALIGGISHDVRTFATRLRLRVESLPDSDHRDRATEDIAAVIRLLDDALLAARAGALNLALEPVEIETLVRREVEDRRALGAPLTLAVVNHCGTALADPLALRRIVGNLVDNACHYGKAARLTLVKEIAEIALYVDDEGPGLPEDVREMLFEPFVRGENSRSRRTGGAGLGLAVARALADGMGGRLDADAAPGGGARFVLRLPCFAL